MPSDDNLNVKHIVISENELNELPSSQIQCCLCGIRVKNRSNLRAHQIKTHRILRDEADYAFYSKQKCTLTTIYHCPISTCKHAIESTGGFSSFYRLKQHYQIVHMEKLYQCEQCESRYPTPSALSYHRRLCGNCHFCHVCSRAYRYKKHLYQHFRRSGHAITPTKASKPRRSIPSSISIIQPKIMGDLTTYTSAEPIVQISSPSAGVSTGLTTPLPTSVLVLPITSTSSPSVNDKSTLILGSNNTALLNLIAIPSTFQTQSSQSIPQIVTLDAALVMTPLNTLPCTTNKASVVSRCCGTSPTMTQDFSLQTDQFALPSPPSAIKEFGVQSEMMDVFDLISTSSGNFLPSTPGAAVPASGTVSVSVNTGTNDDDITAFIGSLFCDASVETNFSMPELVNDFTDTGLDLLGEFCPPLDVSPEFTESSSTSRAVDEDAEMQQFYRPPTCPHPRFVSTMSQAAALMRDSEQQHQSDDYPFPELADESVQTTQFFRHPSLATAAQEHASMQTEQVAQTHVAASTDMELAPRSLYHYLRRSLDTPSPSNDDGDCTTPRLTNYNCNTMNALSPSH